MDKDRLAKQIVTFLTQQEPGLLGIYLFGSHAAGTPLPESDVDVAILGRDIVGGTRCWDLAQQLSLNIRRDVDLVDLRQAPTVLQKEIIAGGALIHCTDTISVELFEASILSAYTSLNEERRGILADIRDRGSVYGK